MNGLPGYYWRILRYVIHNRLMALNKQLLRRYVYESRCDSLKLSKRLHFDEFQKQSKSWYIVTMKKMAVWNSKFTNNIRREFPNSPPAVGQTLSLWDSVSVVPWISFQKVLTLRILVKICSLTQFSTWRWPPFDLLIQWNFRNTVKFTLKFSFSF